MIVAKKSKALVLPASTAVSNVFPDAPKIPQGIIVPHDIRNTLLLRHMGMSIPSPINTWYDYPAADGSKPFDTQRNACAMLTENPRAFVLSDKGTGKSRTILWAWDFLNRAGLAGRLLVVAPKSTLRATWESEVFALFPDRKVSVLYGRRGSATRQQRLNALAVEADIYIINHDGIRVVAEELKNRPDIDTLALDELSVYRNPSERYKLMKVFAQRFKIVWGATGGPMPQEPTDVWCQSMIVNPTNPTLPKRRKAARELLMTQISQFVWKPRKDAVETAYAMMQPNIRYTLADVTELPELVERTVEVPFSAQQKEIYEKVRREMVAMVEAEKITAVNQGVALNKLLQVCAGWVYTKNPEFVKLDADPRISQLVDDIMASANKVLVAIPFRAAINGIEEEFRARKVPFKWATMHGDTRDRDLLLANFQQITDTADDNYSKVLLCDPRTISHGVTLTAADTTIWYSPIASFETYDQFNARVRRYGQKNRQLLLHYASSPAERKLYRSLRDKGTLQMKLLDLLEAATEERDARMAA